MCRELQSEMAQMVELVYHSHTFPVIIWFHVINGPVLVVIQLVSEQKVELSHLHIDRL